MTHGVTHPWAGTWRAPSAAMANPFRTPQELDGRKRLAGIAAGAAGGAATAAAIGAVLAAAGDIWLVGNTALLGALVGGAIGEAIVSRVDLGPWEPLGGGKSYVGTHMADDPDAE